MYCRKIEAIKSDFFLIEDIYNNFVLCNTIIKKVKKKQLHYTSNPQDNEMLNTYYIYFIYNSMKYKYDDNLNTITPVYFDLCKYKNHFISNSFWDGISSREKIKKKLEKYGQNILDLKNILLFANFFTKDLPQCISVFISGGMCFFCGVSLFGGLLMLFSVLVIFMKLMYRYVKFIKVLASDLSLDGITEYKVKRNFVEDKKFDRYKFSKIKNIDLLPGDIILLNEGEILPCDGILLDGECIVNESAIFGTIDNTIKYALEDNNNMFNYERSKNSILLHGSEILKIYTKNITKIIVVLIINTGSNTSKGNLLINLLHEKLINKSTNNFYELFTRKYYMLFILLLYIASTIGIYSEYISKDKKYPISKHLMLNLSLVLMPIYYIIIFSIK